MLDIGRYREVGAGVEVDEDGGELLSGLFAEVLDVRGFCFCELCEHALVVGDELGVVGGDAGFTEGVGDGFVFIDFEEVGEVGGEVFWDRGAGVQGCLSDCEHEGGGFGDFE